RIVHLAPPCGAPTGIDDRTLRCPRDPIRTSYALLPTRPPHPASPELPFACETQVRNSGLSLLLPVRSRTGRGRPCLVCEATRAWIAARPRYLPGARDRR